MMVPWSLSVISIACAEEAGSGIVPGEVIVTATRSETSSLDIPAAVNAVGGAVLDQDKLQSSLAESLPLIPGILVQNRQNFAQDLQISSRGFGARATFGVNSLRIFVDGIPATQPDGQSQTSNIDLGSAARIEVLRGPFSALYGNAAGGVISVFTEDGAPGSALNERAEFGSFDTSRYATKASGDQGGLNYVIDAVQFHTRGYRAHSAANRQNYNAKVKGAIDAQSSLTFIANAVHVGAQDPLGLTRTQYVQDPHQADPAAAAFNTRKYVDQEQFGLTYENDLSAEDKLSVTAYGGNRDVLQYQSIPLASQRPATSPGGVIDLAEGYGGVDAHGQYSADLWGGRFQITPGISYDVLDESRRGFQNFLGTMFGIEGPLRRDEKDFLYNFDQYIQAEWQPDTHWIISGGVRHSHVSLRSHDEYIVPGNGDDSGATHYDATRPVAGVTYKVTSAASVYFSYGEGFETPTLDQVAYRSVSGTSSGLNLGLQPSRSADYEVGFKANLRGLAFNAAAFHITTRDELAVSSNFNGRSVYQNIGRTDRDGLEIGLSAHLGAGWAIAAAETYLRARYAQSFVTCPGLPCTAIVIPSGNRLPGIPLNTAYSEISWQDAETGLSLGLEGRAQSRVFVNDNNSDSAPFYLTVNLRAGLEQEFGKWRLNEFFRVENIADRRYAGSVIVNESNGRYFEPAPGRSAYVGLSARWLWAS